MPTPKFLFNEIFIYSKAELVKNLKLLTLVLF